MKHLAVLALLVTSCAGPRPVMSAYLDDRVLIITVVEGDVVKQRVLFHDPENHPAYRTVTGPVEELDILLAAQGLASQ